MTAATAQKIAEDYSSAWMSGDVDQAMSYIADDIVCEAPGGTIEGTSAYRKFLADFLPILTKATVTKVLGDDTDAAIVYTCDTKFVVGMRAMDYATVADGKITHVVTVFDRLPMDQAKRYQQ
jgi:ketosteroid isomerase-like protein